MTGNGATTAGPRSLGDELQELFETATSVLVHLKITSSAFGAGDAPEVTSSQDYSLSGVDNQVKSLRSILLDIQELSAGLSVRLTGC